MLYKDQLLRIAELMEERREDLAVEAESLPDGDLYTRIMNGKRYFYQRMPAVGNRKKEHRFSITNDPDMIRSLIRKRYVLAALEALEYDAYSLRELISDYRPTDEDSLLRGLREKLPELDKWFFRRADVDVVFDAFGDSGGGFMAEGLTSTSSEGTKMRSKSELYIASRLEHFGIQYRYELPLGIPDVPFVPDFTILRKQDNKMIYWEHFGKVNDESYMKKNRYKLEVYERYGIVPWDNLIVTYDKIDGGMNAKVIDAMIEGWLL